MQYHESLRRILNVLRSRESPVKKNQRILRLVREALDTDRDASRPIHYHDVDKSLQHAPFKEAIKTLMGSQKILKGVESIPGGVSDGTVWEVHRSLFKGQNKALLCLSSGFEQAYYRKLRLLFRRAGLEDIGEFVD